MTILDRSQVLQSVLAKTKTHMHNKVIYLCRKNSTVQKPCCTISPYCNTKEAEGGGWREDTSSMLIQSMTVWGHTKVCMFQVTGATQRPSSPSWTAMTPDWSLSCGHVTHDFTLPSSVVLRWQMGGGGKGGRISRVGVLFVCIPLLKPWGSPNALCVNAVQRYCCPCL